MKKRTDLRQTLYNRGYHSEIVVARREERKKIARELHDSVGQELTVVSLEINRVLNNFRELADNAVIRDSCDTLQRAYDQIRSLSTQVGRISHLLHPSALQQAGLQVVLKRLCTELHHVTDIEVNCECPQLLPKMSFDVCLCMYRIAQEALHNVAAHAAASTVEVSLSISPGAIELRIKDDGCGFDPSEPRTREGVGLRSMAERTRALGGQLLLTTKIREGTQIIARLPTREW